MINGNSVQRGQPFVVDLGAIDAPPAVKAISELVAAVRASPRTRPLDDAALDEVVVTVFCAVADVDPAVQRWLFLRLAEGVE